MKKPIKMKKTQVVSDAPKNAPLLKKTIEGHCKKNSIKLAVVLRGLGWSYSAYYVKKDQTVRVRDLNGLVKQGVDISLILNSLGSAKKTK